MADSTLAALTQLDQPTADAVGYFVNDPSGTPVDRKVRFDRLIGRTTKQLRRATGTSILLNSTAIAEVAAATNGPGTGGFDLAVRAVVGDILEWGFNGNLGSEGVITSLEIYTMVSGSRVNPFGSGLSASLATTIGPLAWTFYASAISPLTGSALLVVQAGDIESSLVTCRPHYAQATASNRTLNSSASQGLQMWLKNLGPSA